MIIVLFYATLGGMKGLHTQVAQYCVLIFAFMVPALFLSNDRKPCSAIRNGRASSGDTLLDKLNGLSTDLGFSVYTNGTKSMVDVFAITLALMVGTAGLPHVIVRFTVKRVKDARNQLDMHWF
jgi:cation/acetate symporter